MKAKLTEAGAMKTTGRFERSEDGQTWEVVDPQLALRRLAGSYRDVDAVVRAMTEDGQPVRTPYAFYRFVR